MNKLAKLLSLAALSVAFVPVTQAQFLRTSYFMEGSHYRMQLNPALAPSRGYINLPAIGSLNASVNSSSLGTQDIIDIIDNSSDDGDYFMKDDFINRLDATNDMNVNVSTDILSAGWYKGKNFWSVNFGLKTDLNTTIPRTMFDFMRDMNMSETELATLLKDYNMDMGGGELHLRSYAELGIGLARNITSRLTVGARAKLLLGIGDMNLKINKMAINSQYRYDPGNPNAPVSGNASIQTDAVLETSFKGLKLEESYDAEIDQEIIDDIKFEADELGIAGYGFGIDLGASYKLLDNLTLSASLLDLGFIKWSKNSTQKAVARASQHYTVENYTEFSDMVTQGDLLNYDMLGLEEVEAEDRTTGLTTTLVVGAEYDVLRMLSVGALYTGRFAKPNSINELSFSANFHPNTMINLSASYSVLQGAGKTFGLAAKLGPLFIGTDYMFFGNSTKNVNAYLGVSIPLGKQKIAKKN